MTTSITVVATDAAVRDRLAALIPTETYAVMTLSPNELGSDMPQLFVVSLPGLGTPEEEVIQTLRAEDATANIPIVIVSALPMIDLQAVPYAGDWTIAIVEEPVDGQVLGETMGFLLHPE